MCCNYKLFLQRLQEVHVLLPAGSYSICVAVAVAVAVARQVESKQEVASGSEAEVELRAASIVAVELLKDAANTQLLQRQGQQQQQQQQKQGEEISPQQQQQHAAGVSQLLSIQVSRSVQRLAKTAYPAPDSAYHNNTGRFILCSAPYAVIHSWLFCCS
jgi:ATP/maltotriose-dependent transcriptional regulator MalT